MSSVLVIVSWLMGSLLIGRSHSWSPSGPGNEMETLVLINITSTEHQSPGQSKINKLRDNLIIVATTAQQRYDRYL